MEIRVGYISQPPNKKIRELCIVAENTDDKEFLEYFVASIRQGFPAGLVRDSKNILFLCVWQKSKNKNELGTIVECKQFVLSRENARSVRTFISKRLNARRVKEFHSQKLPHTGVLVTKERLLNALSKKMRSLRQKMYRFLRGVRRTPVMKH